MPEIYHRRVKTESVRDALSEMRRGLLPEEISSDATALWVLNFDDLKAERSSEFRDQRRNRENEFTIWMVEAMLAAALQRQIPFYFAALFHIGRQWSVSEKSLLALGRATTAENLASSALQTAKSLSGRASLSRGLQQIAKYPTELMARELGPLLEAARDQHDSRLREARRWWKTWREEAENLRNQVTGIQERGRDILDERLWPQVAMMTFQGQRPSNLRLSMQASGLQFKSEAVSPEHSLQGFNDALLPMMIALLASSGGKHWPLRYFDDYVRHYFHDALREAHYRPLREAALKRLDEKYRDSDPFDVYRPLKKPASEHLRDLIAEHTLPGNAQSPSLAVWEECLAPVPSSTSRLSEGDVTDFDTIRAFAASADSTIKKNLREEEIELGESWVRFIQRLFESWIHDLAEEVADRYKAARGSKAQPWDLKHFAILVEGVVGFLTKMGYGLKLPSTDRLKRLWEALRNKEPGDTSDW